MHLYNHLTLHHLDTRFILDFEFKTDNDIEWSQILKKKPGYLITANV